MTYDIVIVGGGLSGLALGAELAQAEFSKLRVLVLEQRQAYVRDRTWSYWRAPQTTAHRYSHLERQQWPRWRVRLDQRTAVQDCKAIPYCTLDGDAFYAAALEAVSQSSHVELRLGTSVQKIVGGDKPCVETSKGEVIAATWVFDARPPRPGSSAGLVQQFVGCEIKTHCDVFDATTVELMHFQSSAAGLHFFYLLPYSPRKALIETTWISPASFKPDFNIELRRYIAGLLGPCAYELVYREAGSLSLGFKRAGRTPKPGSRVVPLGRGAGTLRASTGYAFLETLAHTQQLAESLKKQMGAGDLTDWLAPAFRRSTIDDWMDAVFLKVLERDWRQGAGYFVQLFEQVDALSLVAFLSGKANWRQRMRVCTALPMWPFAAQALATLGERWRGALR